MNIGKELAAMRKTETKNCADCGAVFTALVKVTMCLKCRRKHRKRKYRARKKQSN